MTTKRKVKIRQLKTSMSQRWTAKTCWSTHTTPTSSWTWDRRLTRTKNRTTPTRVSFLTSLLMGSRTPRGISSGRQRCYQIIRNLKTRPTCADRSMKLTKLQKTVTMYKLPPCGYNIFYVSMHVTCFMTIRF